MIEENGLKNSYKCINLLIYLQMQVIFIKRKINLNKQLNRNNLEKNKIKENKNKAEGKVKKLMLINFYKIILKLVQLNKLLNFNKKLNNIIKFGEQETQTKLLLKFMIVNLLKINLDLKFKINYKN
jgi:hypothetical protein